MNVRLFDAVMGIRYSRYIRYTELRLLDLLAFPMKLKYLLNPLHYERNSSRVLRAERRHSC